MSISFSGDRLHSLSNVELQTPLVEDQHESPDSSPPSRDVSDCGRPRTITEETTEMYTANFEDATEELMTWIKAEKQLDVYQMNSFYVAVVCGIIRGWGIRGVFEKRHLYMVALMMVNVYKTALTLFIQTVGASYLAYKQMTSNSDQYDPTVMYSMAPTPSPTYAPTFGGIKKYCDPSWGWLSCMAFAFTAFVSFSLNERITQIGHRGCYTFKIQNCPPYLNKCVLFLGFLINMVVTIVCWISALLTVFFANDTKDMINCGVAIYFVINMDRMMMTTSDYQTIEKWLDEEYFGDVKGEWWKKHCEGRDNPRGCCSCCRRICESMDKCARDDLRWCELFPRLFTLVIPFLVMGCFNREMTFIPKFECDTLCLNYF